MSSPFKDRLFRGYGPLIGFAAIFLAVVLLVPSKAPDGGDAVAGGKASSVNDLLGAGSTDDTVAPDAAAVDPATGLPADGSTAGGTGGSAAKAAAAKNKAAAAAAAAKPGAAAAKAGPPKVAGCGNAQVPGDPYSPICVQFSGDNGGGTSRGVTAGDITVTVRVDGFESGFADAITKASPAAAKLPNETPQRIENTITSLGEYFNRHFQFYGRKLKLVLYNGKGDVLQEILGQGQEGAQADALKVAQEYQAFADISAVTPPYADALSAKGVINMGVPYVSRRWLSAHRPFAWSQFTDCSTVVESVSSYYATKMAGGTATNAGGDLQGKPRKMAIVAPTNDEYQECVRAGIDILKQAGKAGDLAAQHSYPLELSSDKSADDIYTKLAGDGVTTVICGCDPIFLNFITAAMKQNNYFPEMVVTGVALVDNDIVGQIMQPDVWKHAFGVSFSGATQREGSSLGYRAFKSIKPADTPSAAVDLIYNQLYLLALGVQMAGPTLNPASFEKGMFDYPKHTGPYGTWGFGPNDYSTSDDAREIHWVPNMVSIQDNVPGAYVDSNAGKRFPIGQWPGGNPVVAP